MFLIRNVYLGCISVIRDMKIINPSSGAIIMAIGIFSYKSIDGLPLSPIWGEVLTIILVALAIVIYTKLTLQFFQKDFLSPFLQNPVNSFVMGTWVAGISVLCNVLLKYFPEIIVGIRTIAIVNSTLGLLFLGWCIYNFIHLWKEPRRHAMHGVILLSTVATQSLVILWIELFPYLTRIVVIFVITLGILFYICGLLLIGIRYMKKKWRLQDDWTNTNCIIHGALSITGLALSSSHLMSPGWLIVFWVIVLLFLIIIESIEITRAIKRVRDYGWNEGVFTYHISQWSRNFTFGMFYAFSVTMQNQLHEQTLMNQIQENVLSVWVWVVITMLFLEITLYIKYVIPNLHVKKQRESSHQ